MAEQVKATNNFVFLRRDVTDTEKNGLLLPTGGKTKPSRGTILSIGELVKDPKIKSGLNKKALFHPTVGFEIEYGDQTYLVLLGDEIIAVIHETGK